MTPSPGQNVATCRGGRKGAKVCTRLSRPEEASADQFTLPEPVARDVEAVRLPRDVKLADALPSAHGVAASAAGIVDTPTAERSLRVHPRKSAHIELLANPVHQPDVLGAHQRVLSLTAAHSLGP
jgi:hypothetical protein